MQTDKYRKFVIVLLVLLVAVFGKTIAQKTIPIGKFQTDTIAVGETVYYSLLFKHDPKAEIRFPDSTFDYTPFEFVEKLYYPTYTQNGESTDSVVYQLTTFALDSVQRLSLPVYMLVKGDTTLISTEPDSITLRHVVPVLSDMLKVVANTNYQPVSQAFNYWYWLIALGVVVLLGLVLYLVFGERIRKNFLLRQLARNYKRFSMQFERHINQKLDNPLLEKSVAYWKNYLQGLQNIPYTTLTTTEIEQVTHDQELTNSLKNIDRAIYGNETDEETRIALKNLFLFAQNAYTAKIQEVRNA